MRRRATIRTVLLAAASSLLLPAATFATEELATSEDAACTACHVKPGSKRLNDRGKFFELTRSLDGYAEIEASFGRCTFCHRRKPGSKKLTRAGRGFASALGGMEALVEWVRDRHPGWPEEDTEPVEIEGEVKTSGDAGAKGTPGEDGAQGAS